MYGFQNVELTVNSAPKIITIPCSVIQLALKEQEYYRCKLIITRLFVSQRRRKILAEMQCLEGIIFIFNEQV